MKNLKALFTRWYIRRGYEFGYRKDLTAYYVCPAWVKPLLPFLFSPSVYAIEAWEKNFVEGFNEAMKKATERSDTDNATQPEKQ